MVTAHGTTTPQPQTSAATSVIGASELADRAVAGQRSAPHARNLRGAVGERGSQTSLFIRGGDSDDNLVLIDGVDAGDLGGRFDFGTLPTTEVESAEVFRGTDSSLYGADAESGVVSLGPPRGTASNAPFFLEGDTGNSWSERGEASLACTHNNRQQASTPTSSFPNVTMPLLEGIDAARQIRKSNPNVKIIFLTMHPDVAFSPPRPCPPGARATC